MAREAVKALIPHLKDKRVDTNEGERLWLLIIVILWYSWRHTLSAKGKVPSYKVKKEKEKQGDKL